MRTKWTTLVTIAALALGACDPGSDSVEDQQRTTGGEKPRDERGGRSPDVGDEGLVDDDTFGEEGIIDDQTFGDEGMIPDDRDDE
jgi:hypothetical protein